jgi:hypothetical protein
MIWMAVIFCTQIQAGNTEGQLSTKELLTAETESAIAFKSVMVGCRRLWGDPNKALDSPIQNQNNRKRESEVECRIGVPSEGLQLVDIVVPSVSSPVGMVIIKRKRFLGHLRGWSQKRVSRLLMVRDTHIPSEVSIGDSGLDPCLSCVQVKTGLWIKLIKE